MPMARSRPGVSAVITIELVGDDGLVTALEAEFLYDAMDPFAATAVFKLPAGPLTWVFGRDLLTTGLFETTGEGDVKVWPCLGAEGQAVTILELDAPAGSAVLQVPSRELSDFLHRTTALVPSGCESTQVAVDHFVEQLFPPSED